MENNNEYTCNHESKKRKIDEVICDHTENFTGPIIIKQEQDECTEISDQPSDNNVAEVRDAEKTEVEMDTTKSSALGNVTVIPLFRLKNVETERNNDHINSEAREETMGWNVLVGKIEQLEWNLAEKMGSEISALKKSWEENNCKCKFVYKKDVDELTSKIDQLKQENAQQEQQKQLLMKEKTELQQTIDKERAFRSQLSGMLNDNNWRPKTEINIKAEPNGNNANQNEREGERKLQTPSEMKKETMEKSKSRKKKTKKDLVPKIHEALVLPKFIRDKKPQPLSSQSLADEMHDRDQRRYNIVMRGMRYSGAHFYDEIVNLLWRTTGRQPRIVNYVILDSCIVLQMATLTDKYAILNRKHLVRSTGVTVYNDLTTREDQVQMWLHEVATDLKKIGKKVEVRFLKIKIDNEWWLWIEQKGNLVKESWK